jgi:hypothetical protein
VNVITDEDVPDEMGEFLSGRGYAVKLARDHFGTETPDHVIAQAASNEGALVYTFNRRHFRGLAARRRKDGSLRYPQMSVVSFDLSRPEGLARLRALIADVEAVYQTRVMERGARMIAVISETVLRFEAPESRLPQQRRPAPLGV